MAPTGFPTKWFLELEGKKVGPFSPEQILGLLADGETYRFMAYDRNYAA